MYGGVGEMKLVIKGCPITKKNSQRILFNKKTNRTFIAPSKAYEDYEESALWQLKNQYRGEPISSPVNVKCVYYMENRRRTDITNLMNSSHDILVEAGILADDNYKIVASVDGSRVYYDKENPRVEIEIEEVKA